MRRAAIALLAIALTGALVVTSLNQKSGYSGEPLILVTMPGVSDDVSMLLEGCNVRVETLVGPGVDPHTYNLQPSQARLLDEAVLVVSTGHTPLEERVEEYLGPDRVFNLARVEGVRILEADGVPVLHGVQYDPGNLEAILSSLADKLAEILPECRDTITFNLDAATARIAALRDDYAGILSGRTIVVSDPAGLYAIHWLGGDTYLVSLGHDTPLEPARITTAEELLSSHDSIVAIIVVGDRPATKAGEWLLEEATSRGVPVIRVPAPYSLGDTISKLEQVSKQARSIATG